MTGTTVLHYKILEELGRGGMGEVYRAEDTRLGRTVALKFLPASLEADPDRRLRLFREAQAISRLSSPNIATLYDIAEYEGRLFMIMELVRGEPLSVLIARGPMPAAQAVGIALQIARALAEAHAHGVIHRDVKPSNVMISENGQAKVLDFGLAKLREAPGEEPAEPPTVVVPDQTAPGMILGTTWYMSPEQALGYEIDHRTDLFSFGALFYEMLTGTRPFRGATPMQTIDAIVHNDPAPFATTAGVPRELEQIVMHALEKDPARRYQMAAEIVDDLESSVPTNALATLYAPSARVAPAPARRPRSGEHRQMRRSNTVAVLSFANIRRDPADDWLGNGIAETVSSDLKHVGGITVVGRERVSDAVKTLGIGAAESDETLAIRIGEMVGASWIVAGGFQRMGDALRITARFLDVVSGTVVKTIKIDGTLDEIFDLQDRIVRELVEGFDLELARGELDAIERNETQSLEAYKNFSHGITELRTAAPEAFDRAIEHLTRAVEIDPEYAMAWAALGAAYCLKGQFLALRNIVIEALNFTRKAIGLDPENVLAHEWLGSGLNYLGEVDPAIEAFRTAVRIDPDYASGHAGLGRALWLGKGDVSGGIASLERAVELDPNLGYAFLQLAFLHAIAGDYDAAEAAARRAVELQERYASGTLGLRLVGARSRLGYIYYLRGRYEEAMVEYERERDGLDTSNHALRERTMVELDQKLGAVYLRLGRSEEARACFDRAVAREREIFAGREPDAATSYYMASLHALRGEPDLAIARLERVVAQLPAITRVRVAADPDLASLRGLEAFSKLTANSEG